MLQTDPAGAPASADPALLWPEGGGAWAMTLPLAVLGAAAAVLAGSAFSGTAWVQRGLVLMGSLLLATSLLLGAAHLLRGARRRLARRTAAALLRDDPSDCCLAEGDGRILARAPAPPDSAGAPATVAEALAPLVADAKGLVRRLHAEALATGRAEAEVPTRWGLQRLVVQRVEPGMFLWRGEALGDLPAADPPDAAGPGTWDVIEDLPLPLLKLDSSGVILAANRPARALLPMPVGEGTRLSDLLEGLGRPLAEWIADVAEGRPTSGPQFLRGTGGHHDTILRLALSAAGAEGGRHLIAVLDDVSELKAIEAQFVQSQKMQALGQLAGGVAHDFNNLLTAISGHCDLLLLRHDRDDPDYPDLIQISQNVNRAASLVGQLLAFSRKQSMMPETIDLRVALSDLTHLLNRLVGERVRLSLLHDPAALHIRADKRQLEQVVMNLVVNARDAMPDGGEIRIETAQRRLDRPQVLDRATIPVGRYVLVTVTDEGTGTRPTGSPRSSSPSTRPRSRARGRASASPPSMASSSRAAASSSRTARWGGAAPSPSGCPRMTGPAPGLAPVAKAPQVVRRAEGVVLLVEDEAPVRAFAVRALRLRGYTVLEADSAEAALALLADPALSVDLILTDVILPDMDGRTWVRKALEDRPGVRVVFVSGYAEEVFTEQKALISGSVFLPKPLSLVELTAVVERQLAGEPAPA